MGKHRLAHYQCSAKVFAKQGFGNVIGCWAKSAGNQYNRAIGGCPVKRLPNIAPYIAYADALAHHYAGLVQLLCHPGAVGINYLSYQ